MSEKVLNIVGMTAGNGPKGTFEYEIHQVVNEGVKQFRLRLWDYRNRLRVRFAMTIGEIESTIKQLLDESLK